MATHKIEMEIDQARAYSAALVKVAERLETSLGRPDDAATWEVDGDAPDDVEIGNVEPIDD